MSFRGIFGWKLPKISGRSNSGAARFRSVLFWHNLSPVSHKPRNAWFALIKFSWLLRAVWKSAHHLLFIALVLCFSKNRIQLRSCFLRVTSSFLVKS